MHRFATPDRAVLLRLLGVCVLLQMHLPGPVSAQTPQDLRAVLQRYRQEVAPDRRLDLAYEALDRYAPIPRKSSVDPPDREALIEVKRLLLLDVFTRNRYNALVTGSGSTGNWLLRANTRGDYSDDEVPRLKHEGYYLEGVSDLDFAVMGQQATGYAGELYRLLATGRGSAQLTREELEKLEISFMADEQITDVSPGGDPLKFWKQMLDLTRSSQHPEKYLTKGGKALYCIEHLEERGAALERSDPMRFSDWASSAGQTIPPFTAQYLYGGCCDMYYFLRKTFSKTGQEPMKTGLQAVKYLQRQAWMLQGSADNAARLPGGIVVKPEDAQRFAEAASMLRALCEFVVDSRLWDGDPEALRQIALQEASQVCLAGHTFICALGWDLVWKLERGGLTEPQAVVLDEVEYDLRTAHEVRFRDGKPDWYDTIVSTDTVALLEAIAAARPKLNLLLAQVRSQAPRDPELSEVEIGPLAPPPVLRVEIRNLAMTPASARPGEAATLSATCVLHGLLPEGDEGPPALTESQLEDMRQLSYWAWRATRIRAQLQYLMLKGQLGDSSTEGDERPYVSPYEVSELAEELKECEEHVADWSERVGAEQVAKTSGRYAPNLRPAATLCASEDYLEALEDTCKESVEALETLQSLGKELSADLARLPRDAQSGAINLELSTRLAEQKRVVDLLLADSAPYVKRSKDLLSKAGKYAGWAQDVRKAMSGDTDVIIERAGELEEYLFGLAEECENNASRATRIQNSLADYIGLFRRCARTVPESEEFRLRGRMIELVRHWDARKNKLMLQTIPKIEERAQWLSRGAWAAKSVKVSLQALGHIKRYRDLRRELEANLRMTGETKSAVMALAVCGDIIQAGAEYLPLPVLHQVIKDYASLLSSAGQWSTGFTRMLELQRQEHGFDVTPAPRAIQALIKASGRPDPSLFNVDHGDFATRNRLTVIAYWERPAEETGEAWLIWAPDREDGYLKLDDREGSACTFREASLLAARFWRIHRRPITSDELKDLLTVKRTTLGMVMRETVTSEALHQRAPWVLQNLAMQDYIASVVSKQEFTPDELARYRAMMEQAAEQLGQKGFLVGDEDIQAIIGPVKLVPTVTGWWDTLMPGVNLMARAWDYLSDGEKTRVQQAAQDRIKAKEKARRAARERFWEQARASTPGCGLSLGDVALQVEHSLVWERGLATQMQRVTPAADEFGIEWQTTLPREMKGERAYVCKIGVSGHEGVGDEADLSLHAGGDWVIIRTANKYLRIGTTRDLERNWVNDEVLDAGLDGKPIRVMQFPGTETYSTREEALDAVVRLADDGGPMGVKRIFQVWRPNANPKRMMGATIGGEEYMLHTIADTVTLVTQTSGVQTGRAWYFPAEEEQWLRDRGIVPYIRMNPLYLLHATGHGTMDGYVKEDTWLLFATPPNEAGKISVPDPYWMGSVFITDVDTCIGPLTDSYAVAAALGAVAAKAGQGGPRVTVPGTGLSIGPDDLPAPSADKPPTDPLASVADAMVKQGPVRIGQTKGEVKFRSFPPGYVNELLYENNEYGPEDYQRRVLAYFRGLRDSGIPAQERLMVPLEVEAVISDAGGQPAVALYPKGTDWRTTGRVFDGWLGQGGSSTPAAQWLAWHGNASAGQAQRPDPPVRAAVRGPVAPSLSLGGRTVGWSATGTAAVGSGVRLSRSQLEGEWVHYVALPSACTLTLRAFSAGKVQLLVRAGEGRLLDYGEVTCRAGDELRVELTASGAAELRGPGVAVSPGPYDLRDAARNQVVLLTQNGSFPAVHQGKFGEQEFQVTVPKPGMLNVVVQTPGPFDHGQSGVACVCSRIERIEGANRTGVRATRTGGDWKLNPVLTTTTARIEQPGTYAVWVTQAVSLSPTWGDVVSAPPHSYTVTVSLENLQ